MDIQRPLLWHQGLFLQPQHFQLMDLSFRSLLSPFYQFIEPHFWGLGQAEIRKAALSNRIFDPVKAELIFPDGTHVVFPGNALIEARSFEEGWVEGGKPLTVYAGLRKWNQSSENVTTLSRLERISEVTTRFVAAEKAEEVADLHSGGPGGQIKSMYYVLRIFWESEREQFGDYSFVPLAQLERSGGEVKLSESFLPPVLALSASEPLLKTIREIRDQIAGRSHQLEEYKAQRGIQTSEFGTRDMVYLLALRSLNRYAPLLFHFLEGQSVHPWAAYGVLRQIIGELSTFSERVNFLGEVKNGERSLPVYDHRNLGECFSVARTIITQLLDEITAGPEYVVRLTFDGTYFGAGLEPAMFEGRNRFYLVLKTEEDPKSVARSLLSMGKLSSREHLPILIARALPGIALEHLSSPPQELPRRASSLYFKVDHHGDQWAFVKKGNNIALYWDRAPEDLEVELMIAGR